MKELVLIEAMDLIDATIVEKYLDSKFRFEKKARSGKSLWIKLGAIAASIVLIVSSIIFATSRPSPEPYTPDYSKLPVGVDQILWAENGGGSTPNEVHFQKYWNGIKVSDDLYLVLYNAEESDYIAIMIYSCDESLYTELESLGYSVDMRKGNLYLFTTKAEFSDLDSAYFGDYNLHMANRLLYEDRPLPIIEQVNGFAVEKLSFYNVQNKYLKINSDEELVQALTELMALHRYGYDYVEFKFSCEEGVDKKIFDRLEDVDIEMSEYSNRTFYIRIKRENINKNMKALRDLSKRKEVRYIKIGVPYVASDA